MNIIQIYIFATFLAALIYNNRVAFVDKLLLASLGLAVLNEIVSYITEYLVSSERIHMNLYVFFNSIFWLLILRQISGMKLTAHYAIAVFVISAIINTLLSKEISEFKYYNFIIGALIYLILFVVDNIQKLKKEKFQYFYSNEYILLTAPVMFFLGFSLLFGFQNKQLHHIEFFGLTLFKWISYTINVVLYTIINLYVFREYKSRKTAKTL